MEMTQQEALQVLDAATQPLSASRMSRLDYVRCEHALAVLAALVKDQPQAIPFPAKPNDGD